jgi:hypothetical protein
MKNYSQWNCEDEAEGGIINQSQLIFIGHNDQRNFGIKSFVPTFLYASYTLGKL